MRRSLGAVVGVTAACLLALSGCSDGSNTNEPGSGLGGNTQTFSSAPNSSSSASGTSSASVDITCGGDAATAASDAVSSFSEVDDVKVSSSCSNIAIVTSLDPGDPGSESSTTALEICEAAAADVYTDGVTTLTVEASNADVLASGTDSTDCEAG